MEHSFARQHKSHTIAKLFAIFGLCATLVVTLVMSMNLDNVSKNSKEGEIFSLTTKVGQVFEPSIAYAEEDETKSEDILPFTEMSDKVGKDPEKYDIKPGDIAGDQWAALGGSASFFAVFSKATSVVSYNDLKIRGDNTGAAGAYGFMLDSTGLDHSYFSGDAFAIFSSLGRLIFGGLLIAGYALQLGVNFLFGLVISLADFINIFKWFTNAESIANSPFKGMQVLVSDIKTLAESVGFLFATLGLGVGLGLAIFGLKVSRNKQTAMGKGIFATVGLFLFRAFVIFFSPFVLGAILSSLLDTAKEAYTTGSSGSDYAVYSNLVDFEKWATYSRLALPAKNTTGLNYSIDGGKVPAISHKDVLAINAEGAGLNNAKNVQASHTKGGMDVGKADVSLNAEVESDAANDWSMKIISRWMMMNQFTAASYESSAKNAYISQLGKTKLPDEKELIKSFSKDGGLKASGNKALFTTHKPGAYAMVPIGDSPNRNPAGSGSFYNYGTAGAGLSTLGMYNYMSTVLTPNDMTYVQTDSIVGKMTTPYHASVGLTGRGFVAFGNLSIMFATIYALAIMGVMFAFFVINSLIISIPKMFGQFAASALGSPAQFIKLLLTVLIIGVELVGTAFVYILAQKIVIGIATLSDTFISSNVGAHLAQDVELGGAVTNTMYGTINVIAAVLLVVVSVAMIRARGIILTLIGSTLEGLLNNIFGMFEPTAQGTNEFGNGRNGMFTTDADGKNQFGTTKGETSAHSQARGAGGGGGDFSQGAQKRASTIGNARTFAGKAFNAKSEMGDVMKAKEGQLGRPLSRREKAGVMAKQMGAKTAIGTIGGASAVVGSSAGEGFARDLEGVRTAKINNGLAAHEENTRATEELANQARDGSNGKSEAVQDAEAYGRYLDERANANSADESTEEHTATATASAVHDESFEGHGQSMQGQDGEEMASDGTPVVQGGFDEAQGIHTPVMNEQGEIVDASQTSSTSESSDTFEQSSTSHMETDATTGASGVANERIEGQVPTSEAKGASGVPVVPVMAGGKKQTPVGTPMYNSAREGATAQVGARAKVEDAKAHHADLVKKGAPQQEVAKAAQNVAKATADSDRVNKGVQNMVGRTAQTGSAPANTPKYETKEQAQQAVRQTATDAKQATEKYQQAAQQQATGGANAPSKSAVMALKKDAVMKQTAAVEAQQGASNAIVASRQQPTTQSKPVAQQNQQQKQQSQPSMKTSKPSSTMDATRTTQAKPVRQGTPNYANPKVANEAVQKARASQRQAQTALNNAPASQKPRYEAKLQEQKANLAAATAGADRTFLAQSATSVARKGRNLTNKEALSQLDSVRKAHASYAAATSKAKTSPQAARKAQVEYKQALKVAIDAGVSKKAIESPVALKNTVSKLNNMRDSAVNGAFNDPSLRDHTNKQRTKDATRMRNMVVDHEYDQQQQQRKK